MADPLTVEAVFKAGGVPTHTFVEPKEYPKLLVGLRTAGRGVVIEGPSGIGKTSAVEMAIRQLELANVTKLSARKPTDLEYINILPQMTAAGVVVVDDFHKCPDASKIALADFMKTLADEERPDIKLVIVGINKAGEQLVSFVPDLANRVEVIPFENNPENKILELIEKGETAFNISINVKREVVEASQGSFYIAQMLCRQVCIASGILERPAVLTTTRVSFEGVRSEVLATLGRRFHDICKTFCQGARMRPVGRAPYLHILRWLAQGKEWTLDLADATRANPEMRGSVGQVVDKGFLKDFMASHSQIAQVLHYDHKNKRLTVEDPQLVFYIRNIPWAAFAREIGFTSVEFERKYDFGSS